MAAARRGSPTAQLFLVVETGGAPQVAAASRSLTELGIVDVAVCGLAKRMEEVWLPGDPYLPRTSEALHPAAAGSGRGPRFAITYYRRNGSTGMLVSLS